MGFKNFEVPCLVLFFDIPSLTVAKSRLTGLHLYPLGVVLPDNLTVLHVSNDIKQ